MRRFGKLRTRLLSSLRKPRTPRSSTSSAADRQSSARTPRRRESSSDHDTVDAGAGSSLQQSPPHQQLHWSEARRIYSEPATRERKIDRESSSGRESSSTCSSSNLAPSVACPRSGASSRSEKIKGKRRRNHDDTQTLCRSCAEDEGRKDSLADSQCGDSDDDDDDDDVFLESWEEVAAAAISAANGQCSQLHLIHVHRLLHALSILT